MTDALAGVESFVEGAEGSYDLSTPSIRCEVLARRMVRLMELEAETPFEDGIEATPVAVFLLEGDDGALSTHKLYANQGADAFARFLSDQSMRFWNITYEVGTPTVFRPYREPYLDNKVVVSMIDKEHGTAKIVQACNQ